MSILIPRTCECNIIGKNWSLDVTNLKIHDDLGGPQIKGKCSYDKRHAENRHKGKRACKGSNQSDTDTNPRNDKGTRSSKAENTPPNEYPNEYPLEPLERVQQCLHVDFWP